MSFVVVISEGPEVFLVVIAKVRLILQPLTICVELVTIIRVVIFVRPVCFVLNHLRLFWTRVYMTYDAGNHFLEILLGLIWLYSLT
jgi:hypothetical protein